MGKKNNISDIRNCYGCGLCATVCPQKIIEIHLNRYGFYEPYIIDKIKCSNCALCVSICSYLHDELALKEPSITSYGGWSKDQQIRHKCSSGGVGFEIGRYLLGQEYKVCGVRYNVKKNIAEHYIASCINELIPSIGSKYIQSYTVDGFKAIKRKEKYLVTGTPCQIDSFRRYIKKFNVENNFILMDFFCHGVPSMLMWHKYITEAEQKVGKPKDVTWRNKLTGWHDSWVMSIEGSFHGEKAEAKDDKRANYLNSRWTQGDNFYRMFLSDICLGRACYDKCKFKYDFSSADIRIGDAWGEHYNKNEEGVNVILAFTDKGREILQASYVELEELPLDIVASGQMKRCPKRPKSYNITMKLLRQKGLTLDQVLDKQTKIQVWQHRFSYLIRPDRVIKKLLTYLKK